MNKKLFALLALLGVLLSPLAVHSYAARDRALLRAGAHPRGGLSRFVDEVFSDRFADRLYRVLDEPVSLLKRLKDQSKEPSKTEPKDLDRCEHPGVDRETAVTSGRDRWEVDRWDSLFDRFYSIFDEPLAVFDFFPEGSAAVAGKGSGITQPQWTVTADEDTFKIVASLPGVSPADLKISFKPGVLTVTGQSKEEVKEEKDEWVHFESRQSHFERSFKVPENARAGEVKAVVRDGVLVVNVPLERKVGSEESIPVMVEK